MKKIILFCMLLISVSCGATVITGNFNSLKNNDTLLMNGNVTGNINITHSNNILLTNGHTINGNVSIRGNGFQMDKGKINGSGKALTITNAHNLLFNYVDIETNGDNAQCVNIPGGYSGTYDVKFNGGIWENKSVSFNSRESYDGAVFWSGSFPRTNPIDEYDVILNGVTVLNGPCQGIVVKGKFLIDGCSITTDATNMKWDSLYLYKGQTAPIGKSADNSYLILCRGAEPGTIIRNNQLVSGNNKGGSRGILLENCAGTQEQPIEVCGNTLSIHAGPSGENLEGVTRIIRMRNIDNGSTKFINIYDNQFVGIADNDPKTTSIGSDVVVGNFGFPNTADTCKIYNNIFRAIALTSGTICEAIEPVSGRSEFAHVIKHNEFYSSNKVCQFLDPYNGIGCSNIKLDDNTFGFINDYYVDNNRATFVIGYNGKNSTGNLVQDAKYVNGASQNDVKYYHQNAQSNISFMQNMLLKFQYGNNPAANLNVSIKDKYGRIHTSNTNQQGEAYFNVKCGYKSNAGDSTFLPYIVTVDNTNFTINTIDSFYQFQLTQVDNVPSVNIVCENEIYLGDPFTVNIIASDDNSISYIKVKVDTVVFSSVYDDKNVNISLNIPLKLGDNLLEVTAVDNAGQTVSATTHVLVKQDNVPTVSILGLDTITLGDNYHVDFYLSDDIGLRAAVFYVDSLQYFNLLSGTVDTLSLDYQFGLGNHTITCKVYDTRGQFAEATQNVFVKDIFRHIKLNGEVIVEGFGTLKFDNTEVKYKPLSDTAKILQMLKNNKF